MRESRAMEDEAVGARFTPMRCALHVEAGGSGLP